MITSLRSLRAAGVAAALLATLAVGAPAAAAHSAHHDNPNPALFAPDAHPFGASMATWAERASRWVYGHPLDRNPLFDQTGANCDVAQQGPVWYIARIAGPLVFSGTRHCAIPKQKSLFLYIGAVVDEYPCAPFPAFHPAPGQSLYDFLRADAAPIMDKVNLLQVTIDSRPMRDVIADYRYHSEKLFSIRFDPSLKDPLGDPCITGTRQPAIVDGFFMMVKPLSRGEHTIVVHGTATSGDDKTFTYYLTMR